MTKIKRLIESSKRPLIEILAQCSTLFNSDCEHGENNLINQIDSVESRVYGDKVITAQQQTNLADVDDLDLNSFANTILSRQASREDGQFLIHSPINKSRAAAALSALPGANLNSHAKVKCFYGKCKNLQGLQSVMKEDGIYVSLQ